MLKTAPTSHVLYAPGEHDVFADGGTEHLARYGRGTVGQGWQTFDYRGVHSVGLVNVLGFKTGGAGSLGREQLEWLEKDLDRLASSTPIVVFTHIPLWAVHPTWGWVTDDGEQALAYLRRFGSVTVLNGHIHQVMQKVEGTSGSTRRCPRRIRSRHRERPRDQARSSCRPIAFARRSARGR